MISLIVLGCVLLLIAVRQVGNLRLQIWQIMSFGAIAVLTTGQITPLNALGAINLDVLLFLFGMFVVGEALAAGSTIAGNFSILGAASNVIIIQNAEQKFGETLTFLEFVKIGIPLTVVNTAVYWLFFTVI